MQRNFIYPKISATTQGFGGVNRQHAKPSTHTANKNRGSMSTVHSLRCNCLSKACKQAWSQVKITVSGRCTNVLSRALVRGQHVKGGQGILHASGFLLMSCSSEHSPRMSCGPHPPCKHTCAHTHTYIHKNIQYVQTQCNYNKTVTLVLQ